VVNPKRREQCSKSLWKFAITYFSPQPGSNYAHLLYLSFCWVHKDILTRLQQRILFGGKEAIAAPRGLGKDTIFLIACLWAILYGHRRYLLYVGPKAEEAEDKLERIKFQIETNPLLMEDFPEVCAPVRALERAAQRGKTQTVNSEFTYIEWGSGALKFPTVKGSLCSGAVIAPAGIDGTIRGKVSGADRPDFLAINDIETDEAARSPVQRKTNENKIEQGLGGLVGPGKTMAAAMLCTIACPNCLSDKYTNPQDKPAWNGHRYSSIIQFPENMELWEQYKELRRTGQAEKNDNYGREAHEFYKRNRKAMDKGAKVIWPENFIGTPSPDGSEMELSGLEHLMIQWCDHGDRYFFSELQNEPLDEENQLGGLTAKVVASRLNGYEPREVPPDVTKITQGIDVGASEIHCTVLGHAPGGTSYKLESVRIVVDKPQGDYSKKTSEARPALERAVLDALRLRREELASTPFFDREGNERYVDLTLVDSGYLPQVVYKFCRESGGRWRPTKGLGSLTRQKRYSKPVPGEKVALGDNYYAKKEPDGQVLWFVNADYWKEYTQLRFLQDPGTQGCCTLWGSEASNHRMYAKHIVAERFNIEKGVWEVIYEYNHFLDTTALAHCAARMVKIRLQANMTETVHRVAPSGSSSTRAKIPEPVSGERVIRRRRERAGAW